MWDLKSHRALLHNSVMGGALYFALMGGQAFAQDATFTFDIPSEPLAQALHDLARISGRQIMFAPDQVSGKTAPTLHGSYSIDEALSRVFLGTNLTVDHSSPAGLMVREKKERASLNEEPSGVGTEAVVVSGTRVVRNGYSAPTPVTVLGQEQIQASAPNNLADFVNQMPAVIGSATPQNSETSVSGGGTGINALSLRNLGPGRTLVLLDGHRSAATRATGEVDINTIPQQLVKRIDIVTGGASADYGSDAVAGVINFILDKDFTGFKSDIEYGETTYGLQPTYKVSATVGTAFAGGRGHVILSGEYVYSTEIVGNPLPWGRGNNHTVINPNGGANGQPSLISASNVFTSQLAPGGIITSGPAMGTYFGLGATVNHLAYGQLGDPSWMIGGDQVTTCLNSCSSADLAPAQDRKNLYGHLSYDLTDEIEIYASASVADSIVQDDDGAAYPNVGNVTLKTDNAFLPASVRSVLTAGGATQFTFGTANQGLGVYGTHDNRLTERFLVGSAGTVHLFGDWKYDLFGSETLSNQSHAIFGIYNATLMALAQDAVAVTAANAGASGFAIGSIQCRSTLTAPTNGCVPLSRIGIAGGLQSAADYQKGINYVEGPQPYRHDWLRETDTGINITGSPFSDWAGPVSVAFGGEWRLESVNGYVPPQFQKGWQTGNFLVTQGHYSVAEGYIETVVPIMQGLDLNGAIRYAAYSTSGGVNTWKVGANYQPIDDVRFRVTYSHDIRAPNLNELFAAGTSGSQNVVINGKSTLYTRIATGNPNLTPEAANTLGLGVVLTPSFIRGLQASVDYFNINLAHRIGTITEQQTADLCYINLVQSYCDAFQPPPPGTVTPIVKLIPINFASVKEEGIDFDATYSVPLEDISVFGAIPGTLTLHGIATHYMRAYTNDGINLPYDIAGNNAETTLNGVGGLPSWLYRIEGTYSADAWTFDLIGRGVSAGKVANNYIECATGCPLSTQAHPTINNNSVSGAFYVDTTIAYNFQPYGADAELFFNIKNLFNTAPAVVATGGNATIVTTTLQPQTNPSVYDILGRVFRIGLRTRF